MDEYAIYRYAEFTIFSIYLVIIFLSTQIWLIWMDTDKNKLRSKISISESFLKNNIILVFSVGTFFIVHEFFEEANLRSSYLYFEILELLGFVCIVLFMYNWHSTLKTCAHKKPAHEILLEACTGRRAQAACTDSILSMNKTAKLALALAFGCLIALAAFVPISTLFFALVLGLLFVPPALAIVSTLIGAFLISKELSFRQT